MTDPENTNPEVPVAETPALTPSIDANELPETTPSSEPAAVSEPAVPPKTPEPPKTTEPTESFGEMFSQYEKTHSRKRESGPQMREGVVVALTADSIILDIGFKSEGLLPLSASPSGSNIAASEIKPGDKIQVYVKGRDPEGYYELTRGKVEQPTDWTALEKAFAEKAIISGTVTGAVKGGLSVDVGVRAFMPASRTGTKDAAEMEKLVGQEIRCRITKLDVEDEDVVVDRRAIAEDEEAAAKQQRFAELKEGDTVSGVIRSLTDYGAFVDIGAADALLHVGEISWQRVNKPSDLLSVGQQIEARVVKIDPDKRRIGISMKQLQPHPWDSVSEKFKTGDRVRGTITRLADFGAFVEVEPGVEGLIHISEMSWGRKIKKPGDVVKLGESVETVILGVNLPEHRMSLGLKQALGDPWTGAAEKFAPGTVVDGPITSITKFGAFVQIAEGVEGMVHVSEISTEKRINHPQEVLKAGQVVKTMIIALDTERRMIRLSMKQLVPTGLDEYLAEHKSGDVVTGRILDISGANARVELGQGVQASCVIKAKSEQEEAERKAAASAQSEAASASAVKPDLSSLGSMLQARWKAGATLASNKPESLHAGQVRSFRIAKLDPAAKKIELELE